MFHPRASVNIATLGRDKPNHTLARYDNFYQHCCMKPVAEETFECDQNIHTEITALVKNHTLESKTTPRCQEPKKGCFLHSKGWI